MATDKAFEQLKLAALEVKALLIDIDENIQPSVTEIDVLNAKVNELSEQIAIYKYVKSQKELSPSFNLHLKVMEKTPEAKEEPKKEQKKTVDEMESASRHESQFATEAKKIELSLNDKFRMINELFKQSTTEFNLAMDQLNTIHVLPNSEAYLRELMNLYGWTDGDELTKRLFQLNQKRFQ